MTYRFSAVWSTIGKKIVMGLSGLIMIGFLVEHLVGNLLLLLNDSVPYNLYAHRLLSLGWPIVAAELFLVAVLLGHVIAALAVTRMNRRSRPQRYRQSGWAGKPSRRSVASSSMIWTGIVLFIFLAVHLKTFKFGPHYTVQAGTQELRDLYRLVGETFSQPLYVVGYSAAMLLLGAHLWHGFWSAVQSLGINHPRYSACINGLGYVLAVVLSSGFLLIPLWIFVRGMVS